MKALKIWSERHLNDDKTPRSIYGAAFSPNGERLVCAAGDRVIVYDAAKGTQIASLAAHHGDVHTVSYSRNGRFFASGGKDKQVVVWCAVNLEGTLRYSHNESIQAVAFNPQTGHLASCSNTDFGIYTTETRHLQKFKVGSRVLSCSWTNDGQYLALGYYNGIISIRNKIGEEKVKIDRGSNCPVWTLSWHPSRDHILVGDWGQTLSFFALNGHSAGREKHLGYDPCFVTYFSGGDYMVVGGSNRKASVHAKDGTMLGTISEQLSWVWCCKQQPGSHNLILGCQDGTITCLGLQFATVHSLYKERYAYRDSLTDVIVQHLPTDQKTRLRCKELVKRISVYRNRLAIQLPTTVLVYELRGDMADLQYKLKERVSLKCECNLLVVCANHLVLCQERRLQSFAFTGKREREWSVESFIRYIKVIGGPCGAEGLLCGLRSGEVIKIFLNNPFVIPVLKMKNPIRCLDINANHSKVAVVDETSLLQVYNMTSNELLFQEPTATSVSWNTHNEDMLCYSGQGTLNTKTSNFPPHQQKLTGYVVGFSGSKVFCLQGQAITSVDVPQSASLYQFLEKKMFKEAYAVACLGVTNTDWNVLAAESLEGLDFETARKAFVRTRDLKYLELLSSIEERQRHGETDKKAFLGEIYAYQGRLAEAATLYEERGEPEKAIDMYTELSMFDKAKEIIKRGGKKHATTLSRVQRQEAEWFRSINDPKAACEMYLAVGEHIKAINIMGRHNWTDQLVQLVRQLPAEKEEELRYAAVIICQSDNEEQWEHAIEAYRKIDDLPAQIKVYAKLQKWETIFDICKEHPELKEDVYVPYAKWLATKGRFVEVQQAYHQAGRGKEALYILNELTENAVLETRFSDAGYYYYLLSKQHVELSLCEDSPEDERQRQRDEHKKCRRYAELYYAYGIVYCYLNQPFSKETQDILFNMCRYILLEPNDLPRGISTAMSLIAMAKQSRSLEAYKVARYCYNRLQSFVIPRVFRKVVDRESLTIRAKPMSDKADLIPPCYRCSASNPPLHSHGHRCLNCLEPFLYDFVTFEMLPVVEFFLDADITDDEARQLIDTQPPRPEQADEAAGEAGVDRLLVGEQVDDRDLFLEKLVVFESGGVEYVPIVVDRETLRSLRPCDVLVRQLPTQTCRQYFKAVTNEHTTTLCSDCKEFFNADEYIVRVLEKQCCPFCRASIDTSQPIPILR